MGTRPLVATSRKPVCMLRSRLFGACLAALAMLVLAASAPAQAQTNFDRPGGDYQRSVSMSGDPAECAMICERDKKCRAWRDRKSVV